MIGVFGADMKDMQVHVTLMFVMFILVITSQVRPFGGIKSGVLQVLEMASLMATFLTLWAGSVFNTRPKCEDPLKGEGSTLPWCDALSITIGAVDICVLVAIVVCFVYIKVTSTRVAVKKMKVKTTETEGEGTKHKKSTGGQRRSVKQKRLSSRELMMVEMTTLVEPQQSSSIFANHASKSNPMLKLKRGGGIDDASSNEEKQVLNTPIHVSQRIKTITTTKLKQQRKQRVKKLSTTVVQIQNETTVGEQAEEGEVKAVVRTEGNEKEEDVDILTDDAGRRYTYNNLTGESKWLVDDGDESVDEEGVVHEQVEEEQQEADHKDSFEIFEDATGRRYSYDNVTEETQWLN